MSRTTRWIIGIVTVLAILGHAGLMAGDAHGTTGHAGGPDHHARAHGTSLGFERHLLDPQAAVADHQHLTSLVQANDCAVIQSVVIPRSNETAVANIPLAVLLCAGEEATSRFVAAPVSPGHPPSVRRAMIQVYRV